jgi:hypothetical protein
MADLTITAANVRPGTSDLNQATAGETMDAGVAIYLDANDTDSDGIGKAHPADANDTSKSQCVGITVQKSYAGQPVLYASVSAAFVPGATLVKGKRYILSATGGGLIADSADLTTGWRRVDLFTALDTTTATLAVTDTGIVV